MKMKSAGRTVQFNFLTKVLKGVLYTCLFICIAACSNLNDLGMDIPGGEKDVVWMCITVENFAGTESQSASQSRTLRNDMPATDSLTFYLYGKAADGTTWRSDSINLAGSNGSFAIAVERNNWDFTLAAFAAGTTAPDRDNIAAITTTASLKGSCHVDNRRWDVSANFILSDVNLTTPGNVSLTLELDNFKLTDVTPAYSIAASLVDMKTGTEKLLTLTKDETEEKWKAATVSLDAGYWYLKVTFSRTVEETDEYGNVTSTWTESCIWTEVVHIQPGIGYTGTLLIQNIIGAS